MRKILIPALILSSVAVAAPAAAQYRDNDRGFGYSQQSGRVLDQQLQQIRQRIDNMFQRRLISNREAANLGERVREIRNRLFEYSRNGLSQREHQEIQARIHNLRERLQRERFEGREDRRDDRRDRWDDRRDRW